MVRWRQTLANEKKGNVNAVSEYKKEAATSRSHTSTAAASASAATTSAATAKGSAAGV